MTMVTERGQGEQSDALRIFFRRHSDERTKVHRRAFAELRPGETSETRVFQRQCLKQPAIQAIEGIIAGPVARAAPGEQIRERPREGVVVHRESSAGVANYG